MNGRTAKIIRKITKEALKEKVKKVPKRFYMVMKDRWKNMNKKNKTKTRKSWNKSLKIINNETL